MDRILNVLPNIFRQILKYNRGDLVPCGRHTCLLINREKMMTNSEKRMLSHYKSYTLFHKKLKSFLVKI